MKHFDPLDIGIVFYSILIIGIVTIFGCKTYQNEKTKQIQKEIQEQKQIKQEVNEMLDFMEIKH